MRCRPASTSISSAQPWLTPTERLEQVTKLLELAEEAERSRRDGLR